MGGWVGLLTAASSIVLFLCVHGCGGRERFSSSSSFYLGVLLGLCMVVGWVGG